MIQEMINPSAGEEETAEGFRSSREWNLRVRSFESVASEVVKKSIFFNF